MTKMELFAVGSWEEEKFIVDRICVDRDQAIAHCDSRANDKWDWAVMRVIAGAEWVNWREIHLTPRTRG